MILNEGQLTTTNCPLPSHAFTIQNSPLAFEILSSRLYSDPMTAIIRELLSNAYDSQCLVGKENVPIKVHLPDYLNPNFTIRDYGIGLEKDEVMLLYTSFFSSTKSTSNDFTGCFGLGSKTPFSYANGFTVNSYKNGYKHSFMMVRKDKLPHVIHSGSHKVDEPNGLEIIIPINESDYNLFKGKFFSYLKYIPEIKTTVERETAEIPVYSFYPFEGIKDFIQLNFYPDGTRQYITHWETFNTLELKQGTNVYFIEDLANSLIEHAKRDYTYLASFSGVYRLVLEVPIGTFEITPNREMIDSTPKTLIKLGELLDAIQSRLLTIDFPNVRYSATSDSLQFHANCLKLNEFNKKVLEIRNRNDNNELVASGYDNTIQVPYIAWCRRLGSLAKFTSFPEFRIDKRDDAIKKGVSLFIDVPIKYKGTKLTKIVNRLINYWDTFSIYDNIYVNYIPVYSATSNRDKYLDKEERRNYIKFKKIVKEINEQTGVPFVIHYTNLNKLIRKYPNGDKPSILKKRKDEWVTSSVNFLVRKAYIYNYDHYSIASIERTKRQFSLDNFLDEFPVSSTIVFYDEQVHEDMDDCPDWYWIISRLGAQNNYSFHRFVKEHTKSNHFFTKLDNIVSISKRNIKYLKNYTVISVKELIKYYQKLDIKIYRYKCNRDLINLAENFDKLMEFYPKRIQEAISKTTFPRKMKLISKIFAREPSVLTGSSGENVEDRFKEFMKINDKILHNPRFTVSILDLDKILSFYKPYIYLLNKYHVYVLYYHQVSFPRYISHIGRLEIAKQILKGSKSCSTLTMETQ